MRKVCYLLLLALGWGAGAAQDLPTVPEKTGYTKTSLYPDVVQFIQTVQQGSDRLTVLPFCRSTEGRDVPLVVVSREPVRSPADLRMYGKPVVLIMANIHAGEVEGKEACLMLLRDFAGHKLDTWLDNQVILFLPIFNADGNEKLGKNRGDDGPELAGVRYNGQNLDLNRDYCKLESPEVGALVELFQTWDPVLLVDMHTTNGSYHRHPVTYCGPGHPNTSRPIFDYCWQKLFPEVHRRMKEESGYDPLPYGNFSTSENPEKGWENDTFDPRYGTNYFGLRNRFAILDENYSHADFKTRVLASYAFVRAILEFTAVNLPEMAALVREADRQTVKSFASEPFALEYKIEKLMDVTIDSYEFEKYIVKPEEKERYRGREYIMKRTERLKTYQAPYLGKAEAVKTISLPAGYILLPYQLEALAKLHQHGIQTETLLNPCTMKVESFVIEKIELDKMVYQGHVQLTLSGHYENVEREIPAGASYIPLAQPLARVAAALLEPQCLDSLAAWGFFSRVIVQQWSARPGQYPVLRVPAPPPVARKVESLARAAGR